MTTKKQLQKQFQKYTLQVDPLPKVNEITKYKIKLLSNDNKTIAHCTICKHKNEQSWNMGDSKTKIHGVGKLLYYCAMDFVYPQSISSDMCGVSNSAIRVWQALEKVDYVETVFLSSPNWELKPEENDNYSSIQCRFCWSQNKSDD